MARKKIPEAVALEYSKDKHLAPTVTAKGRGLIAEKIVDVAREAEIPIVEDAALVSALLVLELGEEIPPELYQAVAKILSFVYEMDRKSGRPSS